MNRGSSSWQAVSRWPPGSAARRSLRFVARSNQTGVGWVGETPAIGAGSSMKGKFKNTSNIKALKLVAGCKQCTKAAGTEEMKTRKITVQMRRTARTSLTGGGMV